MGSPEERAKPPDDVPAEAEAHAPAPASAPEPSRAVFLSYASQDAEAARRICDALRAASTEVWFDQSELRGGDAWDHSIRKQIKTCALFIPVISRHTHDRDEGYFRLEWSLAVDRCRLMAADKAFLLPVVVDDTRDDDERVPERFREVQWTRLPGGDTSPTFVERVRRLLVPGPGTPLMASAPATGTLPAAGRAPTGRTLASWHWRALLAIAVVAVAALGYATLQRLERPKPAMQATTANSIAVLPLANESGDASQQYFSDGLSEDLITALSQAPGLKVIGRHSSFQFRDSKDDSKTIGAKLGVAHLLEGSVRRAGDMVRVSAELIDTSDGSTRWSERYDRPYKDLFALQDEITRAVAGALRTKLLPGANPAGQSDRPTSGNLDAYRAFLRGNFFKARDNEADIRTALDSYIEATRLDPSYARAWSAVSIEWTNMGGAFLSGAASQEAFAKASTAVETALSLAPDLAAAHVARGYLFEAAEFDQRAAEAEYRRGLQLEPNDGRVKYFLGSEMATLGQLKPAIDLTRQALVTDPLNAIYYKWLALYLLGLNHLDESRQTIRKAIELQPGSEALLTDLAVIEVQGGDARNALAAAQQVPPGRSRDMVFALALQIGSDRARANDALRKLIDQHADMLPYAVAQVYALRKDADKTFEWLDRAWSIRDAGILSLLFDPFILRYKDDPRLAAFCRKAGLPVPGESHST